MERVALLTVPEVEHVAQAVKASIPSFVEYGFNPEFGDKIDFTFKDVPQTDEAVLALQKSVQAAVESAGVKVSEVRKEQGLAAGSASFSVITQGIQDKVKNGLQSSFAADKPEVRRVEYVGPAVGRELRTQGFKAILFAMALIVAYVGLRFDFRFSPGVDHRPDPRRGHHPRLLRLLRAANST